MKIKIFAVLLACVLLMTLFTSCNVGSKSLTLCGEDVISLMSEMIENDYYISLYSSPNTYKEQINSLRQGDYSKSSAVYEIKVSENELMGGTVNKEEMSDELYQHLCSMAYTSFATRVNQASGIEAIAVASIFTAQKIYANNEADANTIYLFVFEKGRPIAVTFVTNNDGALRAVGHFIMNDAFNTENENSIKESCKSLGLNDITVKKQ